MLKKILAQYLKKGDKKVSENYRHNVAKLDHETLHTNVWNQ